MPPTYTDVDRVAVMMARVRGLLENALESTPDGSVLTFSHQTAPPDDCCDFLAVWVSRIFFTRPEDFPEETAQPWGDCSTFVLAVELGITLSRSCWPTIDESQFPAPADMNAKAESLSQDALVLWCALLNAHNQGLLLGTTAYQPSEHRVRFGSMLPYQDADCAGWDWSMTIEMDACCKVIPETS